MVTSPGDNAAAIALNRFGLGARPDDTPPADPKAWLLTQFEQYQPLPAAWAGQPTAVALATQLGEQRQQNASASTNANASTNASATTNANANADPAANQAVKLAANKAIRGEIRDIYRTAVDARVNSALTSSTPFIDRLVHFWANHFAVSIEKPQVAALAGAFEMEAIRPHVLGRFDDMPRCGRNNAIPTTGAGSTRTSHAKSWNCTRLACAAAIRKPMSPSLPAHSQDGAWPA
jgi:uncharacterized protein (DUF1800 family)